MVDVRDVLEGRAEPAGRVVVVDDLGFHQATSVAELLADRGCEVEIVTAGMVVGQDLGITLDMETFNVRAHAKGIRQATDLVVIGAAAADGEGGGASRPAAPAAAPGWSWPCSTTPPASPRAGAATGWCARSTRHRRIRCGSSCAGRRLRCTGSATASPRAGPMPP